MRGGKHFPPPMAFVAKKWLREREGERGEMDFFSLFYFIF